ncbi:MAG: BNR-4 repeat-containing protein [Phycisphaeraceae bacterium]|nr:MAG: BNR-4 repeat-containing protein [Phycisphaeraceae bacterium]
MQQHTTTRGLGFSVVAIGIAGLAPTGLGVDAPLADDVTFSYIYPYGYNNNSINSVAFSRSNVVTEGGYQFTAFYSALASARMQICRRPLGTDDWTVVNTALTAANVTDDHDNVNLAVDGDGHLHVSWGMHNNPMRYRISDNVVTGPDFNPAMLSFTAPAYWTGTSANHDSSVTYPEFYKVPNSGDLLFIYRQGESGDGDTYFTRFDNATDTFEKNLVLQGSLTSVNAYLNRLAYTAGGELFASWTWRSTPAFQTNHNIMFARSADDGVSWRDQNGNGYTLPITEPQAQIIANIPQNSSLINQTDMTVDQNGHPLIATWYAPLAGSGNDTRQYMLHWYDGATWHVTQLSDRVGQSSAHETSDAYVRDLGRPVVLVDGDGRTYVIMRYDEAQNNIVVAYSMDKVNWDYIRLTDADMGSYEPSYDHELWVAEHKLHMYYQAHMGDGAASPVSILQWDAGAHFAPPCPADVAEPFGLLDLADINAFITGFLSSDPIADIAAPFGVFDLADVNLFVTSFLSGCP